jgi:hypothetical protein
MDRCLSHLVRNRGRHEAWRKSISSSRPEEPGRRRCDHHQRNPENHWSRLHPPQLCCHSFSINIVSLAPEGLRSWFVKPKLQSPSETGKHFTPPTKHVVLSAGYTVTVTVIDELKQIPLFFSISGIGRQSNRTVSCAASKLSFHSGRLAPLSLLTTHRSSLVNKS